MRSVRAMMPPWPIVAIILTMMSNLASGFPPEVLRTNLASGFLPEEQRIRMDEEELPLYALPLRYDLKLKPNFDDASFNGSVAIKLWCQDVTDIIILNAHKDLDILKNDIALMHGKDKTPIPISDISRNDDNDTLTITLAEKLSEGDQSYLLHIKFGGQMKQPEGGYFPEDESGGFFLGKFENMENTGKRQKSWFAITSVYPNNARKLFPCFDKPGYKAEFQISIARPANLTAISLTRVESTEQAEEEGYMWDHFALTPSIPPFAVAVILIDMDNYDSINVTSPEGEFQLQIHFVKNQYASSLYRDSKSFLDIVIFLQDYFNITYPINKLDIITLPNNFAYSTEMNSLGIYQPHYVSAENQKSRIALVNQFVQTLCTPINWQTFNVSYLLSTYIARILIPDEMDNDAMFQIIPRSVYYQYASEFNRTEYDEYELYNTNRGELFLRMLDNVLGGKAVRNGIRHFLLMSMNGIYREETLWDYIGRAGWEEGTLSTSVELLSVAENWLHNKLYRFPVVTVMRNYPENTANLEQHTFTSKFPRNLTLEEEKHLWSIPITYITPTHLDPNIASPSPAAWMTDRELTISNLPGEESFVIMNPIDAGMYLVNYDPNNWKLISHALMNAEVEIPAAARAKLLRDALFLARGRELDYITVLNMTLFLRNEKNHIVWIPLIETIAQLETHYMFSTFEDKINAYLRKQLKPIIEDMEADKGVFWFSFKKLYEKLGCQPCIDEARKTFEASASVITVKDEDTGLELFCPEFMNNISDDWSKYHSELQNYFGYYGYYYEIRIFLLKKFDRCPNYMEFVKRILNSFLDEDIVFPTYYWHRMLDILTSTKTAQDATFDYFLQNYKELKKKFYFMKDMWTIMVDKITQNVRSEEGLSKLLEFYESHNLGYAKETVEASISIVKKAVEWTKRNGPDFKYWFENVLPEYE